MGKFTDFLNQGESNSTQGKFTEFLNQYNSTEQEPLDDKYYQMPENKGFTDKLFELLETPIINVPQATKDELRQITESDALKPIPYDETKSATERFPDFIRNLIRTTGRSGLEFGLGVSEAPGSLITMLPRFAEHALSKLVSKPKEELTPEQQVLAKKIPKINSLKDIRLEDVKEFMTPDEVAQFNIEKSKITATEATIGAPPEPEKVGHSLPEATIGQQPTTKVQQLQKDFFETGGFDALLAVAPLLKGTLGGIKPKPKTLAPKAEPFARSKQIVNKPAVESPTPKSSAVEKPVGKTQLKPPKIEQVKISDLPDRATSIGMLREEFDKLASDIIDNGVKKPIIIDKKTGQVLDGQHRAFVSKELGLEEIPAIFVDKNKITLKEAQNLSNNYTDIAPPKPKSPEVEKPIVTEPVIKGTTTKFEQAPPEVINAKPLPEVVRTELPIEPNTKKIDVYSKNIEKVDPVEAGKQRPVSEIAFNMRDRRIVEEYLGKETISISEIRDMVRVKEEAKAIKGNEVDVARRAIDENRALTPAEVDAVGNRWVDVSEQISQNQLKIENFEKAGNYVESNKVRVQNEILQREYETLVNAGQVSSTIWGRTGQAMQKLKETSMELPDMKQRAKELKGGELTRLENEKIEAVHKEYRIANEELKKALESEKAKVLEQERKIAELVASKEIKTAQRRTTIRRNKAEKLEADAKKKLVALGWRVNDITGITVDALYQVGKIATAKIMKGASSLDEVVKLVQKDIPHLSKEDVYRALGTKDPKRVKAQVTEANRRSKLIKKEADLLTKIEDAMNGVIRVTKNNRTPMPAHITKLQAQLRELRNNLEGKGLDPKKMEKAVEKINNLQDQLYNNYRIRKSKRPKRVDPEQLRIMNEQVQDLKAQINATDRILDLEYQMKTGEFKFLQPRPTKYKSPELRRLQVNEKLAEKQLRSEIEKLRKKKGFDHLIETGNLSRTLRATADASGSLRQGMILASSRPKVAFKSFIEATKAAFDARKAEEIDIVLRETTEFVVGQENKLHISELGSKFTKGEEMFLSNLAEKIPVWGEVVKASERHMLTYLNLLRQTAFNEFYHKFPNASAAELTAWADFINNASGRGNLGSFSQAGIRLSQAFFAPRFAVSRINTPFKIIQHWKHPEVRKFIAKDMAAYAAMGNMTLFLANMSGLEVGYDPRDANFGKIRFGNTRVDMWAGVQQPMRMLTRMGLFVSDNVNNPITGRTFTGSDLLESEKESDWYELLGRFMQYKTAPLPNLLMESLTGKTLVGEPTTLPETAARAVLPLIAETVFEAYKKDGWTAAGVAGTLEFFGVGVSTYYDSESKVRKDIRALLDEGRKEDANNKRKDFNKLHPDKYISPTILDGNTTDRVRESGENKVVDLLVAGNDKDAEKEYGKLADRFGKDDITSLDDLRKKAKKRLKDRTKAEIKTENSISGKAATVNTYKPKTIKVK